MKGKTKGKACTVPAPKAKTPPAKRMAEGGEATPRTVAQGLRSVHRQHTRNTPPAGQVNRIVQGKPQQFRTMDDTPSQMRKNRESAKS